MTPHVISFGCKAFIYLCQERFEKHKFTTIPKITKIMYNPFSVSQGFPILTLKNFYFTEYDNIIPMLSAIINDLIVTKDFGDKSYENKETTFNPASIEP